MRIAQLASNFIRIPPTPRYLLPGFVGAPEAMVALITEELVKRGHRVTLFASGDSKTSAQLVSVTPKSSILDKKIGIGPHVHYEYFLASAAYQLARKGKFDIIHSHLPTQTGFYAPLVDIPTVTTIHSPIKGLNKRILKEIKDTQYYISLSNAQRKSLPELNYIATAYHGLKLNEISFREKKGEYLLFVGRVASEKGVYEAIQASKKSKERLLILGNSDPKNSEQWKYWLMKVKPYIDNKKIIHLGFVPHSKVFHYFSHAKALLFPISWEEPFGLVMIEAMACGTPVIAFRRGSVPEIVVDGKTGFIVDTVDKMVKAIKNIDQIDRQECRRHVEKNFIVERMVDRYEEIYRKVLKTNR